ncbi:hypothetical protein AVEN_41427-1, partial [Araneus ventricosus]
NVPPNHGSKLRGSSPTIASQRDSNLIQAIPYLEAMSLPTAWRPRWPSGQVSAGGFQVRNPIPLKIRCVLDLLHVKSYVGCQTSSRWCGAEVWRGGANSGVILGI